MLSMYHGIGTILEIFVICRPLAATWDPNVSGGCGNQLTSYLVLEICGLLIDLAIFVLPLRTIWNLKVSHQTKISLSVIFSAGIL